MKKSPLWGLAALLVLFPASGSFAVDILNEDEVPYALTISSENGEKDLKIQPGELLKGVCANCAITLEDLDVVEADSDEVVVIREGALVTGF